MPEKNQDLQSFARELCAENKTTGRDSNVRNQKNLCPRRPWWVTETRKCTFDNLSYVNLYSSNLFLSL